MEKILLKKLYIVSAFGAIIAGVLALGIVVIAQFYFIKVVYPSFWLYDILFALIVSGIVFVICLGYIWFTHYFTKRYKYTAKLLLNVFFTNSLFSLIPLLVGGMLLKLLGNQMTSKVGAIASNELNSAPQPLHLSTLFLFFGILFFVNIFVHLMLYFVISLDAKTALELENAQLRMKNMESTYLQLKQQISPHFLFNALNTLKSLIRKQPEDAEIYLKRLSDFLRTSVTSNDDKLIKLSSELKFCADYLELQKVRFGDALQFSFNIPEEVQSDFVPGFSIQQLLENAIKHNMFTIERPLFIELKYVDGYLIVSNNKQKRTIVRETSGTGLMNLAERYKIISGDEIIIREDDEHFSVSIKILSHENSHY
jgi:sensor histidine kinase YesM